MHKVLDYIKRTSFLMGEKPCEEFRKNFDNSSRQFRNILLSLSLFLFFSIFLYLSVTKLTDIFRRNARYRQRIRGNQREIDTIQPLRLKPGKTGNYRRKIYHDMAQLSYQPRRASRVIAERETKQGILRLRLHSGN